MAPEEVFEGESLAPRICRPGEKISKTFFSQLNTGRAPKRSTKSPFSRLSLAGTTGLARHEVPFRRGAAPRTPATYFVGLGPERTKVSPGGKTFLWQERQDSNLRPTVLETAGYKTMDPSTRPLNRNGCRLQVSSNAG